MDEPSWPELVELGVMLGFHDMSLIPSTPAL